MLSSHAADAKGRAVGGEASALPGTSDSDASRSRGAHLDERSLLDAHFVSLVRGYEQLYMPDHPLYRDRRHRSEAWAEIGTIVNQPADFCKKKWNRMRANYFQYLERAKRSGNEPKHRPERPAHEKMMTFLDQTFLTKDDLYKKSAKTMHDSDKEASESENDTVENSIDDHNSLSEAPPPAFELQDSSEEDEIVDFFVELGESVKDFPEAVRIHVKREAFRIVTDAEEMLYHSKQRADLEMNTSE